MLGLWLALLQFEQVKIFVIPCLLWQDVSYFAISSEKMQWNGIRTTILYTLSNIYTFEWTYERIASWYPFRISCEGIKSTLQLSPFPIKWWRIEFSKTQYKYFCYFISFIWHKWSVIPGVVHPAIQTYTKINSLFSWNNI
jgi:hypothetical protein